MQAKQIYISTNYSNLMSNHCVILLPLCITTVVSVSAVPVTISDVAQLHVEFGIK